MARRARLRFDQKARTMPECCHAMRDSNVKCLTGPAQNAFTAQRAREAPSMKFKKLFGWLGFVTSLVLDLAIGMALAAVIAAIFRLANGA